MNDLTDEEREAHKNYLEAWTSPQSQKFTLLDASKLPMDIVCNGFKMKDVIIDVLNRYNTGCNHEEIADEISDAFAIKLRLKQG